MKWDRLDELLRTSTHDPSLAFTGGSSDFVAPGVVLLVGKNGSLTYHKAFGSRSLFPKITPVQTDTVFDVASLTKALVTSVLCMKFVERGQLDIERRMSQYLQTFGTHGKEKIKLRHLLSHSSGLPAHIPYYQELDRLNRGARSGIIGSRGAVEFIYNEIFRSELEYPTASKSVYSDVGFILLARLIESLSCGQTLERLASKEIIQPLKLSSTGYIDLAALKRQQLETINDSIAPTIDCSWRGRMLHGEVHDDNAWAMGGVASHAGLFSNALDVHILATVLLESFKGRHGFVNQDVVKLFWRKDDRIPGSSWAMAWDTPSPEASSSGKYFSEESVGHLGYTGCSLWVDLKKEVTVVLLTNRLHPSGGSQAIKKFRPAVHDLVMETLGYGPK